MKAADVTIFDTAKRLADALAISFGKKCEVVVHDFSDLSSSLIHIAGNMTGRSVGAPITDLAYKTYKEQGDNAEDLAGYRTIINGRVMKSSTIFLRNDTQVIGCMCVNVDVTDFLNAKAALEELTYFPEGAAYTPERFASSFHETLESILEGIVRDMGKQPASMDKDERLEFIRRLNKHDVFVFKGAVNQVAQLLGVTRYTVYNDLKELRQADEATPPRG